MKILILVTIITWSFQNTPSYRIVSSVTDAAIIVFNDKPVGIEPDHKKYELWEVDFKDKTLKKLSIPEVIFK